MGDVYRNEKARQKHRQLLKEVCGCTSVPSSVVGSESSSVSLVREELGEDNHFGWAVYDRSQANEEYERLRHQESLSPHKEYVVPKTTDSSWDPRSPKTGHARSSFTDSTQVIERGHPVRQHPASPRNEGARLRHRQVRKEEFCCSSITSEASSEQIERQEFNEDNHFGWTVISKAYGDPEFERLMQFHEKPDITGNEFQKKTYVLYLTDGTVIGRDSLAKAPLPIGDLVTEKQEIARESGDKEKKKNLISELLYLPFKERSRSRSPKTGKSRQKLLGQLTDHKHAPLLELAEDTNIDNKNAGDISDKSSQERDGKKNKIGTKIKRGGSLRRYLRAGGDGSKKIMNSKDRSPVLPKMSGIINYGTTFVVNPKRTDTSTKKRVTSSEYLLDTPSGANEYLYLSKRNVKHRVKPN